MKMKKRVVSVIILPAEMRTAGRGLSLGTALA